MASQPVVPIATVAMAMSFYDMAFKPKSSALENTNEKSYDLFCVVDYGENGCYGVIISSRASFDTSTYFSMPVILTISM